MRKFFTIILIFLSIVSIILQLLSGSLKQFFGNGLKAGIRVESNIPARVFLNEAEVGMTPFQDDNLKPENYLITLKKDEATSSAQTFWEGYVKLNEGTVTIAIRDIADTKEVSSGEIISLEPGKGATITSSPTNAQVYVDSKLSGRTPLYLPDLAPGEHQFLISRENFLSRSIRSKVIEELNLVLNVDLAITEPDLTKLPSTPTLSTKEVVIKNTPTGFLRVRESATLNSKEVGQVKPKEEYILLEEVPGWVRIRLKDSKEGWVSSAYIQKK